MGLKKCFFCMMVPVHWNNVPDNIQLTMTQKAFRKTIKVISFDICVSMIRSPIWKCVINLSPWLLII